LAARSSAFTSTYRLSLRALPVERLRFHCDALVGIVGRWGSRRVGLTWEGPSGTSTGDQTCARTPLKAQPCLCTLSPATAQQPSRRRPANICPRHVLAGTRRTPATRSGKSWAGYIPAGGTVAGRGGGPVTYPRRDIVDAIRYVDHNSCVWRALPVDFPPWPTVYHYFRTWNADGTLARLHGGLREQVRQAEGRHAEPSAAILDS
jgi:transposase